MHCHRLLLAFIDLKILGLLVRKFRKPNDKTKIGYKQRLSMRRQKNLIHIQLDCLLVHHLVALIIRNYWDPIKKKSLSSFDDIKYYPILKIYVVIYLTFLLLQMKAPKLVNCWLSYVNKWPYEYSQLASKTNILLWQKGYKWISLHCSNF